MRVTIDPNPLADAIEQYLATETVTHLEFESRVSGRTILSILKREREITIDIADRLCLAMQVRLEDVAPAYDIEAVGNLEGWCRKCRDQVGVGRDRTCPWCGTVVPLGVKRGPVDPDKHLRCITPEQLAVCYQLYGRGLSLRQVAEVVWERTSYKSAKSCTNGLHQVFRTRGWKLRPQREVTIARNHRHGRSSRAAAAEQGPDYRTYRREQRKRNGDLRDVRCSDTNVKGEPCQRWALSDSDLCVTHDPRRAAERQARLEKAWASARARMLRWGDLRGEVERAISEHSRTALCRSAGVDPSVMTRMLRYADDQAVKPETWAKLERGITALQTTKGGAHVA